MKKDKKESSKASENKKDKIAIRSRVKGEDDK